MQKYSERGVGLVKQYSGDVAIDRLLSDAGLSSPTADS